VTLTGLAKTAAKSFGQYGTIFLGRAIRVGGEPNYFSSAGSTTIAYTATDTSNRFRSDGATLVEFTADDVETVFQSDGSTTITFAGSNGVANFRSDGATAIVWDSSGATGSRFQSDGATEIVFYPAGQGQLLPCITGSGEVPGDGGGPANAVY
jgi:hypothetical protein